MPVQEYHVPGSSALPLPEYIRMKLQLVNRRYNLTGFQKILNVVRKEIADTDSAYPLLVIELLQCFPCFDIQFLPVLTVRRWLRPVNQIQIQVVCLKIFNVCSKARKVLSYPISSFQTLETRKNSSLGILLSFTASPT